jgi:hypothetical protein
VWSIIPFGTASAGPSEDHARSASATSACKTSAKSLETIGPTSSHPEIAGAIHDDNVLDFDGDPDPVSPLLVEFVNTVTHQVGATA